MRADLIEALLMLDEEDELHLARLLILAGAFSGADGTGRVQGLTKLAKLDFLLRYPVLLERALQARGKTIKGVDVQPHERESVESRMVRYRFGPWDHRYRRLLNTLIGRELAEVSIEGRTISIGLTQAGLSALSTLADAPVFADYRRRARILKRHFDLTATNLMKFVYETFPEILDLKSNEAINL